MEISMSGQTPEDLAKLDATTASVATLCATSARLIGAGATTLDQAIQGFVDPPEPDKPGIIASLNDAKGTAKIAIARADALLSKLQRTR
jgi:hypothetical protein